MPFKEKTKSKYSLWRVIILCSRFNFFLKIILLLVVFLFFQKIISSFVCPAEKSRFSAISQQYLRFHSAPLYNFIVKSHNRTAVLSRLLTLFRPEVLTPENDYHCKSLRVFTTDVESKALVEIINTSRYMKSKQGI